MTGIRFQPRRLLRFMLIAWALLLVVATAVFVLFMAPAQQGHLFSDALALSSGILLYGGSLAIGPLLLLRSGYYLVLMVRHGRQPNVALFSHKFVFNPLNLLLFPSLLNGRGRRYRRRSLVALLLFLLLIGTMTWVARSLS